MDPNVSTGKRFDFDTNLGPEEFACGPIYALELAMNNHARYVKTRADVLIVWFHWCLLRNGFYFFGGELTHNDFHSETLPPNLGFNGDRRAYVLKYGKGVMPYAVGFYLKGEGIDISFISLYRSLRLNIGIEDLVDECLNLQDDVVQQLTMLVDEELIKPMQLDNANVDDSLNQGTDQGGVSDPGLISDTAVVLDQDPQDTDLGLNDDPIKTEKLFSQNRGPYSKISSGQQNHSASSKRASAPQTLMAISSPIQTKTTVPPKRFTAFPINTEERYKIQRESTPNVSKQTADVSEQEEEDAGRSPRKRRGGCCG